MYLPGDVDPQFITTIKGGFLIQLVAVWHLACMLFGMDLGKTLVEWGQARKRS